MPFNPRNDKPSTPEKIDLSRPVGEQKTAPASGGLPRWALPVAGVSVVALGLAGYFALFSGGNDNVAPPQPRPPITETHQLPVDPLPPVVVPQQPRPPVIVAPTPQSPAVTPQQPVPQQTQAGSIQDKENSIYRNDPMLYRDDRGHRAEVYLDANGREVRQGQDFAVHICMYQRGAMSVFIAAGPYAGTRIGFFPALNGRSDVTYEKVGTLDARGYYTKFPVDQRISRSVSIKNPPTTGDGVSVPDSAASFQKDVFQGGETLPAFWFNGLPQRDGIFSIKLFDEDTYAINLNTGEFTVNSVFAYYPNWQDSGVPDGAHIPTVNGVIRVEPALRLNNNGPAPAP